MPLLLSQVSTHGESWNDVDVTHQGELRQNGGSICQRQGGENNWKGVVKLQRIAVHFRKGFKGEQNEVHDPTILRLMQANCQGLKRLAVQSIWCRRELG